MNWPGYAQRRRLRLRRPWFRLAKGRELIMIMDEQFRLKIGLAEMLKGGVIMDVVNAEQAVIAEKAGAVAVMALERGPSDIREEGGVARMCPVMLIRELMSAVCILLMA